MIFSRCSFVLCAMFVAVFFSPLAFAQATAGASTRVPGAIKATNVVGTVTKIGLADKAETALKNGDVLSEQNVVVTGGNSSVILVFANGSTVKVGRDSRLEIKQFLMDPLDTPLSNIAALTNEPTTSQTELRLEFGEIVGNVKTLNRAAGSSFSVSTPAGAAGIRGTIFRIVYRPTGTGQAFNYTLSTSEGVVLFEGTTQSGALASVSVPGNQEVVVVAQVDPATNSVVISAPTAAAGGSGQITAAPISTAAATELQTATVQIVQTQQQTTFTQVDFQVAQQQVQQQQQSQPQSQNQQGQPGQSGQQGNQPGQTPPNNPPTNNPPPQQPTVPRTTPGDGRP